MIRLGSGRYAKEEWLRRESPMMRLRVTSSILFSSGGFGTLCCVAVLFLYIEYWCIYDVYRYDYKSDIEYNDYDNIDEL